MVQLSPHPAWVGMSIEQIERRAEMRVAWLTRGSAMIVASDKKILQDGDLLHCAVTVAQASSCAGPYLKRLLRSSDAYFSCWRRLGGVFYCA